MISQKKETQTQETTAEKRWDERAHSFYLSQKKRDESLPSEISKYFMTAYTGIESILDVGGGAGRYAIPFASWAKRVHMTDISQNMLNYALENAEQAGLSNVTFSKLDWDEAEQMSLEMKADLVFASMCPAVNSEAGIQKMMHFSDGYCAINRFIVFEDSLTEAVRRGLGIEKNSIKDPHNDRKMVKYTFNLLWDKGYTPEIKLFSEDVLVELSLEEAKDIYVTSREIEEGQFTACEAIIEAYSEDGICKIRKRHETALIIWRANKTK